MITHDDEEARNNGVLVGMLVASASIAMILIALPARVRELLEKHAWRKFMVQGTDEIVTYAETEWEKFAEAPPPAGLGLTNDRLMRMTKAAGGPDAAVAIRLMNELVQPAGGHGGRRTKAQVGNVNLNRPNSRGGNSPTAKLKYLKKRRPLLAQMVQSGSATVHSAYALAIADAEVARAAGISKKPPKSARRESPADVSHDQNIHAPDGNVCPLPPPLLDSPLTMGATLIQEGSYTCAEAIGAGNQVETEVLPSERDIE